jgi:APA family basic amino acid/polyamine antiporter
MESRTYGGLGRKLGLLSLTATGICSMIGASIYVVPFMVQRHVPGIGPHVVPAFVTAAIPAALAALAYAMLSTAMPRAGGSYVYVSRSLTPYLGFVASFAQWFGLSIAIGVVSYVIVPFVRDLALAAGAEATGRFLDMGAVRVTLALCLLWFFVWINVRGARAYELTLIPLMILMFVLGGLVIAVGFAYEHHDYAEVVLAATGESLTLRNTDGISPFTFLSATAVLFSSFIGFDSIAQAGGEARNPGRNLPLAIVLAIAIVATFYFLFTTAVYHAVPWSHVADEAATADVTAAGLLRYLIPAGLAIVITAGAAIALTNDLPAMILSVSRLMFAWAEDSIFPKALKTIHPKHGTPHKAIIASGCMATAGILGSHFAGSFFLGVDIMVTSMLVNFILVCASVIALPSTNPGLASAVTLIPRRGHQRALIGVGVILLSLLLAIHVYKDLTAEVSAWYFRSTPSWLAVMSVASLLFGREWANLKRSGTDVTKQFSELPPE